MNLTQRQNILRGAMAIDNIDNGNVFVKVGTDGIVISVLGELHALNVPTSQVPVLARILQELTAEA